MRVVVAIDESNPSKAVLDAVANREWHSNSCFLLLNVLAVPSPEYLADIGLGVDKKLLLKLRDKQKHLLEESVAYLKEKMPSGNSVCMATAEGHAAENIVKVATDWEADLILIGSHHYTGLAKFMLGSVAEYVLVNAPCSVEVVRHKVATDQPKVKKKKMTVLY